MSHGGKLLTMAFPDTTKSVRPKSSLHYTLIITFRHSNLSQHKSHLSIRNRTYQLGGPRGHAKNELHWPIEAGKIEMRRDEIDQWISNNQETCLFCAESLLVKKKTQRLDERPLPHHRNVPRGCT